MHCKFIVQCKFIVGLALMVVPLMLHPKASDAQNFSWVDTYGKSPTQFTVEEWRAIIDATWGAGLDTPSKLALFDTWWNELDTRFGGFHGIDIDLDAMRDRYRPKIEAGVSKGRFSGIMTHFTYQLQELHTYLFDTAVRNTPLNKGVPQLMIGQYGNNTRFGALLTPLPDSTLVVYEALASHPINLQRGDLVLGYDGVLWKDIYPKLIEAELPLFLNPVNANTEEANYFYAMHAAGMNWHLFDTIDIVKYSTGDTLHFDTHLLNVPTVGLWGKDQIPPPGVPWPNRYVGNRVGWGVIDDTNVGMVTVTSWAFDAQFDIRARFETAVDELMHTHDVDGIIFDFRYNTGGGALAREGLQLLFNEVVPTVGFDQRVAGSEDRFAMEPDPARREANLVIQGDPNTYFDKPIAILIGPGAISAGELEARRMSFHPEARIFGLPAAGGNTGSDFISIGDPNWLVSRSHSAQYLASDHTYITHTSLEPDERVWFTREDVAKGEDTVIKAALNWIDAESTGSEEEEVSEVFTTEVFPNPFNDHVALAFTLDAPVHVSIDVFDVLGRRVARLNDDRMVAGSHRVRWDGTDASGRTVAHGMYIWRITAGTETDTGRVMYVR